MGLRLALVYPTAVEPFDAIDHYCDLVSDALKAQGNDVRRLGSPLEADDNLDALILQYNPFSYGPRGMAPRLLRDLRALRRRAPTLLIALMVHEAYVPMNSVRWALMGAAQRLQYSAILG